MFGKSEKQNIHQHFKVKSNDILRTNENEQHKILSFLQKSLIVVICTTNYHT